MARFPHASSDPDNPSPTDGRRPDPPVRLTLRLPADLAAQVRALSRIRGCASSMLIVEAVTAQIANLPDQEKAAIGEVLRIWNKRRNGAGV